MWKVGQKLVCVDNSNSALPDITPKKGEIVTFESYDGRPDTDGIFVEEYQMIAFTARISFKIWRFRPVQDSAIDEILKSIKEVKIEQDIFQKELV